MSDFALALKTSPGWGTLTALLSRGKMPHAWAFRADPSQVRETALFLSRVLLCQGHHGADGCAACRAWEQNAHPDVVEKGAPGAPPGIEECRKMMGELALTPVAGHRKIAVIYAADRLSLPAANSLLKITEEPPAAAVLLLALENDVLLSTLRSRAYFLDLRPPQETRDGEDIPPAFPSDRNPREWCAWLLSVGTFRDRGGDRGTERFRQELQAWSSHLVTQGTFRHAEILETIRALGEGQRLSLLMMQDLICLALKEEYPIEDVFGTLW